jgi:serine/threonine protein kinase
MTELQNLLKRFHAGEIGLDELTREFESLLLNDSEMAMSAPAWLDAGEQEGRLSNTVCSSLRDSLESHLAAAFFDPDIGDMGAQGGDSPASGAGAEVIAKTLVIESGSTALGSRSISSELPPDGEQVTEIRAVEVDVALQVGSLIGGRYELLSQLGSGGMGKVFKARDRLREEAQDRDMDIALKILSDEFKDHPDSMIALQREAKRAQTLSHPNVINVHDFFRDGPHLYLTMELLEGKPLDEKLRAEFWGGLPFDEAWPIIKGLCSALQYGHKKGIVHSDIKPANIFICDDGSVKVLDLGIARPIPLDNVPESEQTTFDPGKRLGSLTPAYASLEMWYQDTPDPRDDIYALACVAYMLLTGIHPFKGKSAKKAAEQELAPKKIDSISRGQWSAITGGLEFHRSNRIKSVDHFLSLFDPQSVVRKKRRIVAAAVVLVLIALSPFALEYYDLGVEQRAMDDRGRLQGAPSNGSVERPVLTPAQQEEIDGLIRLAEIRMESISDQASAEDIAYLLSLGPNSVVHLVETVLDIDPGYEAALELRQRTYDLYVAQARELAGEESFQQALTLTRNAEAVIPNTVTVRRLFSSICDSAPPALCDAR